ncbi:anti-sigma factor [Aurantimonas sp. HBX-1]|uniref:anti-sigma factor family protein n=1 Tax=Aurantimonas sp. HBX-1 TaxID=2906072 RepID=UPI001F24EE17|nr:anti-sigma factor [Aurantimonas sp. HBX-1]UIJ73007.1 anti-sigma factor [Aurantimonas sp. HBX-1]
MSCRDTPVGEDDLQAYVDGRLSAERRPKVEAYLAERPETAAALERDREIAQVLRQRLAFKADEPIPARLRIANIREARHGRFAATRLRIAAVIGWVILGSAGGWLANDVLRAPVSPTRVAVMADEAIAAHRTFVVEVVHPVEVRADEEAHLLQWLSKRLGTRLSAPDLTALGYRLMGGRLLPAGAGPAAMLMYDDDRGTRLTLFIKTDEKDETSFQFVEEDGVSALFWRDAGLGYVVSAQASRERLMQAATAVYESLNRPASSLSGRTL